MTDELKPCQCGSTPIIFEENYSIGVIYYAQCDCYDPDGDVYDTKEEAIAAWNKRQGENDAKELCAKLNRLAALEAVCREMIKTEKGCGNEELKSLIKFWKRKNKTAVQLGLFLETEYCLEELEQQRVIAQKLKAVLEENNGKS